MTDAPTPMPAGVKLVDAPPETRRGRAPSNRWALVFDAAKANPNRWLRIPPVQQRTKKAPSTTGPKAQLAKYGGKTTEWDILGRVDDEGPATFVRYAPLPKGQPPQRDHGNYNDI